MATKRIGVVFPGYGEQFIGMGKDLYDELRIVQEFFEQAAGTAEINFVKLLFASSDEEISSIRYSYLAIYLFETSLYEVLRSKGLRPDFVAGHGIGEYSAAYATKSLSFVDGLYILNKYAQFYDQFIKDKKYEALRIVRDFEVETLQELCVTMSSSDEKAYVASQNSQHAFYVAGHATVVEKIKDYCVQEVIRKVRIISPAYGMHSSLVDEVVDQLKLYYHKIKFNELQVPLITNVDGVYVTTPESLESALMRKINNRIEWYEVMKGFEGCDVVISVGPGTQLIEWFQEIYPEKEYHVVASMKDFENVASYLQSEQAVPSTQSIASDDAPKSDVTSEQPSDHPVSLYEADLVNELPNDFDIDDDEEEE